MWAVAGEVGGEHAADPGILANRVDFGLDRGAAPAGLAAGQGGGQLVELPGGLGQGLVEAAGLALVQGRGVGEHDAAVGAVNLPAGVEGGQAAETLFVDDVAFLGGQGEQVRAVGGGYRADEVQAGGGQSGQVGDVVGGVLARVEDHRHLGGGSAAGGGEGGVPGHEFVD